MMQHISAGGAICRVLGLALLGFVAVTTAGVVIPVLTFAAMGYGIYSVFAYIWSGKWPEGWRRLPGFMKTTAQRTWTIISWPVAKAFQVSRYLVCNVFRLSRSSIKLAWSVSTETISDTILGAAVGVLISIPMQSDHTPVIAGAVMGGVIGLWSGLQKWWGPKKTVIELTPLHVPAKPPQLISPPRGGELITC